MTAVLEADEAEDGEKVESLLCGAVKVGDDDNDGVGNDDDRAHDSIEPNFSTKSCLGVEEGAGQAGPADLAEPAVPGQVQPHDVRGQRVCAGGVLLPPQEGRQGELQVQGKLASLALRRGDTHVGLSG